MILMKVLLALLISFFTSFGLTALITKYGMRIGLADIPNERSSHKKPTPKGGGFAISLAVALSTLMFLKELHYLVILSFGLSLIGLKNDFKEVSIRTRLLLETILAGLVIYTFKKEFLTLVDRNQGFLMALLTGLFFLFYITASANFFNFMDGINGIAGVEAVLSFGFISAYTILTKDDLDVPLIALTMVVASLGFLIFNISRAKVFMGDAGSLFIGFLFAALVVYLSSNLSDLLFLMTFQSLFYIDCIGTISSRLLRKENVFQAHKSHLYQRMVHQLGLSHMSVTLSYGIGQIIVGILAMVIYKYKSGLLIPFCVLLFIIYYVLKIFLFYKKMKTPIVN